ncbi:hypothetical protein ACNPPY_13145 [Achromobacter sp. AGC78]
MHWSDKYVGLPYVPETGDCAALAARVSAEVFGIRPLLPVSHAQTLRDQSAQIIECREDLAERVENATDGCPALFIGRGRLCHIGVMCWIAHEWWVLHADKSAGSVIRQRLRDMTRIHFKLEGYYRWKS